MPVGEWTVSQSIKDTQDEPGCSGQQDADEIQTSGTLPDPSEQDEDYKTGMKTREEDIKKFHLSLFNIRGGKSELPDIVI